MELGIYLPQFKDSVDTFTITLYLEGTALNHGGDILVQQTYMVEGTPYNSGYFTAEIAETPNLRAAYLAHVTNSGVHEAWGWWRPGYSHIVDYPDQVLNKRLEAR